jgi:3-oxoacyl-[acyl-carrier-protein] synthase II
MSNISANSSRPLQGRRVVVTGLGAVSPNGIGRERFWSATCAGRSGVNRVSGFAADDCPTRIAGQVLDFEPERWLPAKELKHVSRVVPLALAASHEALVDADLRHADLPLDERRRFAVVLGSGGVGLEFMERQIRKYYTEDPKGVSLYTIPSATPGSMSSELSMAFDLRGPSHVLSTGCTSSTDALGHALALVRYGRADRVLAGGADSPISRSLLLGYCLMKIMTPSWNDEPERGSRPFSADRDGFVLAEGAWMLVLEALDVARARGARIYGEIAGYAFHRVRLDESGIEPARAMTLALEDAGVAADSVDFVAAHGTSTLLNDRIETRALRQALGERARRVPVSSVKSMIGHPQGACGAAGVAVTLLAMRDDFVHPTINHDRPDPECDLDVVPNRGRAQRVDTAICNTIGFGSKNAALVLRRVE